MVDPISHCQRQGQWVSGTLIQDLGDLGSGASNAVNVSYFCNIGTNPFILLDPSFCICLVSNSNWDFLSWIISSTCVLGKSSFPSKLRQLIILSSASTQI